MPHLSLKVGIAKVSLIGKIPLYLMKENKIMHVIGKTFFSGHLDYFLDLIILLARACLVAQMVKRLPAVQEIEFNPWVGKIPWRRKWQPSPVPLPGKFHRQESGRLQSMRSQRIRHD